MAEVVKKPQALTPKLVEDYDPLMISWQVTICRSRYGGTYEGGKWLAIPKEPEFLPKEILGGDTECGEFFGEAPEHFGDKPPHPLAVFIGRGENPGEAFADMVDRGMRADVCPYCNEFGSKMMTTDPHRISCPLMDYIKDLEQMGVVNKWTPVQHRHHKQQWPRSKEFAVEATVVDD